MVKRTYTALQLQERHYPKLSDDIRRQLSKIAPSTGQGFTLWPCSVVMADGNTRDNVCLAPADAYIEHWGIWPEDDPEKSSLDLSKVRRIEASRNRLPTYIADKIYAMGETSMGGIAFSLVFSDSSEQTYSMGDAIDFVRLPARRSMHDIVDVKPAKGADDPSAMGAPKYYWCLFSE